MNYLQNIKVAESWNLRVLEIVSLEGTSSPIFLSILLSSDRIEVDIIWALVVKNLPANAGDIRDVGLIHGSGRFPGGRHGNPLQCLVWSIPWTEEPGRL